MSKDKKSVNVTNFENLLKRNKVISEVHMPSVENSKIQVSELDIEIANVFNPIAPATNQEHFPTMKNADESKKDIITFLTENKNVDRYELLKKIVNKDRDFCNLPNKDLVKILLTKHSAGERMPTEKQLTELLKLNYKDKYSNLNVKPQISDKQKQNTDKQISDVRKLLVEAGANPRKSASKNDMGDAKKEYEEASLIKKKAKSIKRDEKIGAYSDIAYEMTSIHDKIKNLEKAEKDLRKFDKEPLNNLKVSNGTEDLSKEDKLFNENVNSNRGNLTIYKSNILTAISNSVKRIDENKNIDQQVAKKVTEPWKKAIDSAYSKEFKKEFGSNDLTLSSPFKAFKRGIIEIGHKMNLINDKDYARYQMEDLAPKAKGIFRESVNHAQHGVDKSEKRMEKARENIRKSNEGSTR